MRNRKAIRNSISSFPTNAKNRLSSISERLKNPRAYNQFDDALSPSVSGSQTASAAGARAASVRLTKAVKCVKSRTNGYII